MTADEVNTLFNTVCDLLNRTESGRREWWIFQQVIGDSNDCTETLNRFLKNVTTCPPEIILFCQQLIAPTATRVP